MTVFGRKHCYRLYTEHLNEAVHWVCALQKVIVSKAPMQTPTQLLMCDLEVRDLGGKWGGGEKGTMLGPERRAGLTNSASIGNKGIGESSEIRRLCQLLCACTPYGCSP